MKDGEVLKYACPLINDPQNRLVRILNDGSSASFGKLPTFLGICSALCCEVKFITNIDFYNMAEAGGTCHQLICMFITLLKFATTPAEFTKNNSEIIYRCC